MERIEFFEGEFGFLSNFYPSEIDGPEGVKCATVEHAFQAEKSNRPAERRKIANAPSPGAAKRLGRGTDLRPDWEEIKERVMYECLCKKFKHPELRAKLLATGDAYIIEGNHWHDCIWGKCICSECKWEGQNLLGKLLMKVRTEIRSETLCRK